MRQMSAFYEHDKEAYLCKLTCRSPASSLNWQEPGQAK